MKRKNFFSRNGLKFYALISLLLLCNIGISAQTDSKAVKVTISPQTGNIISVRSESSLGSVLKPSCKPILLST